MHSDTPLWQPSSDFTRSSNMDHYRQWLYTQHRLSFQDYEDLWQWSVDHVEDFWETIWQYFDISSSSHYQQVLKRPVEGMIGCSWFEGSKVNYAEHIFRNKTAEYPALLFASEQEELTETSWAELESQVASLAAHLKDLGVVKGDRVASFLPNIPQAVIAFLATNSLGAVWSSCSPDFGTASVVDRFRQIEPKVLFVPDGYSYNGKGYSRLADSAKLVDSLPSLEQVIFLPYLDKSSQPEGIPKAILWEEALSHPATSISFEQVAFSDPIWILYSSGTTGKPKAITHSVGGCLLEHVKALGLHQNVKAGDRFFWYSTTGWMMWNYAVASLLVGGSMVIFDGAAAYPDIKALWDLAEKAKINHFGGGAAFYIACMKRGMDFTQSHDLSALQSIGSTGSPLPPEAFEWIYKAVKQDLWLASLSGGTDVCSGFVGGNPYWPVYAGEIQCRMLGAKVEALNEEGEPVIDALGEMVLSEPMPSMPIYFWKDEGNQRYHSSYFDMYPGLWRHGDWIKITSRGTPIIYGRSDATLNRGGVRIGTSEVYSGVDSLSEIADSLVLSIELEGGRYYMPLFVVLAEGVLLDDTLRKKISQQLRSMFSPRHVPDEVIEVTDIPYTISGKKMEAPVKKILMGIDPAKAVSKDAMKNPEAIDFFVRFYGEMKGK